MKIYKLTSMLSFGKYKGENISSILEEDPQYIEWCLINLDHFMIDRIVQVRFNELYPEMPLSKDAERSMANKTGEDSLSEEDYESDYVPEEPYYPTYHEWLNEEFGDQAETAYWNLD